MHEMALSWLNLPADWVARLRLTRLINKTSNGRTRILKFGSSRLINQIKSDQVGEKGEEETRQMDEWFD